MLFGVEPLDQAALVVAMGLLTGVTAVACYLPVRRATRVDAVLLLRAE